MIEAMNTKQRRKGREAKSKSSVPKGLKGSSGRDKASDVGDGSTGSGTTGSALALKRIRERKRLEAEKRLAIEEQEKRIKASNEYYSKLGIRSAARRVVEHVQKERLKRNKQVEEIIEQQRRSVQAVNVMRLILPHYQPAYKFKSLTTPEMDKRIEQLFEEDLTFYH